MAKSKRTSNIYYDGFEGIDTRKCHSGKESSSYIENFRIKNDGSLEKRYGYQHVSICPDGSIVDLWYDEEIRTNNKCIYLTDAQSIMECELNTGQTQKVTSIPDEETDGKLFFYQGDLYLKNTKNIYLIKDKSATSIVGYVPLMGKNWETSYPGEIYQPRNLMHNKVRISYKIPEVYTSMLPTLYPISSVSALYRNGKLVSPNEYSIDSRFDTINVNSVAPGDEFLAVVNLASDSPKKDLFFACKSITSDGNLNDIQICAWNSTEKNLIFTNTFVHEDDFNQSEEVCPNHGALYFPENKVISMGDNNSAVNAVIKYYDKLLVFGKKETWLVDPISIEENKPSCIKINSQEGCYNPDACTIINSVPYTVGSKGLLKWDIDPNYPNRSKVELISQGISEYLTKTFLKYAMPFYSRSTNEIWFYNNMFGETVFVYDLNNKNWVTFSNIIAAQFFEFDGKLYFQDRSDIFRFSKSYDVDIGPFEITKSVVGKFESGILSFSSTDAKRLSLGKVIGDLKAGEFNMDIACDNNEAINLKATSDREHSVTVRRLNSGRFRNLKFSFTCTGPAGMTVHSVKLTTRSKE